MAVLTRQQRDAALEAAYTNLTAAESCLRFAGERRYAGELRRLLRAVSHRRWTAPRRRR